MCKLVNQESAPDIDIDVFGGKPSEFHHFVAVFDEPVEKKIEDPRGKLTRHTSSQMYHWGSKGEGQKLHTTSIKGWV